MRLAFGQRQPPQPLTNDEEELADHDLEYLLTYLATSRGETYELIERPDRIRRTGVAPDYLVREIGSARSIAIERALIMNQDLQAAVACSVKKGAGAIIVGPENIDPTVIAHRLGLIVARKIARGQLLAVSANERILLLRNRLIATPQTYLVANAQFTSAARGGVDHAYVIADSQLLELW